ncbi:hypothetical protein BTH42_29950 [Burkholderia sp. SRS-W-2-2016]|uniref:contact-dependent growth inhibition system immunity protein n=1 Tax=Burkholderia sp. SRS-W-2-2016 TaxID=1926878 RepID=UPI00094B60E5|nr:contact-dependent growth inhibition system immunity protein [Burkholderia sp. SRS-W-2-2016]OLL28024.1 hypothetical protein BTH42_29950 [Burkholderia sp. SRS-W-2-2016]
MDSIDRYPAMDHFFMIYFGQDFDLFGRTASEIVDCYKENSSHCVQNLIHEIDSYRHQHADDLAFAFEHTYLTEFSPEPWGYTVTSFPDEIQRLLRE